MTDGFQPVDGRASRAGGFLGLVVDGSLANGIDVRLDAATAIENVKVGTFVTIQGSENQFFGVVTDVALGSTDPRLKHGSVDLEDPFISQVLLGTVAYGTLSVLPNLIMPVVLGEADAAPTAAKTILPTSPGHTLRRTGMCPWSSDGKMRDTFGSAIPWTWMPRSAWTWVSWLNAPLGCLAKAVPARPF